MTRIYLTVLAALLCACDSVIIPAPEEPDADAVYYACNWQPEEPSAERLVVDLALFTPGEANVPEDEAISIIQQAGGLVVHHFNTNLIRVDINKAEIASIVSRRVVQTAFVVNDRNDLSARLDVLYQRAADAADVAAITKLGVRVYGAPIENRISVLAQDEIISRIRSLPGVSLIRAKAIGCEAPY